MEITGFLVKKLSDRNGESVNGAWRQAEFLVEVPGNRPRRINFSVRDGNVGRIARFELLVGKTVTVSFDIDAREWQGKWFNDLNAWGIMEYVSDVAKDEDSPEPF